MRFKIFTTAAALALALPLAACDVDQTEEGDLPEVEVQDEGNLPEYDVDVEGDIEVEEDTFTVPTPEVETEEGEGTERGAN